MIVPEVGVIGFKVKSRNLEVSRGTNIDVRIQCLRSSGGLGLLGTIGRRLVSELVLKVIHRDEEEKVDEGKKVYRPKIMYVRDS